MRSSSRLSRPTSAFTLIELLAIILIVGILSALLFSAIGRIKAKSSEAKSLSNLRQLGMMAQLYAADNNGALVPSKSGTSEVPPTQQWQVLLAPYAYPNFKLHAGTGIWDVATPTGPRRKEFGAFWLDRRFPTTLVPKTAYWQTGYGINCLPGLPDSTTPNSRESDASDSPWSRGYSLVEISKGPQRILISEWPFWNMYVYSSDLAKIQQYANSQGGKLRALFFDGHVSALTPEELMAAYRLN